MIKLVAIGKKHEDWILPGIDRYQKRLKAPFNLEWVLLRHSSLSGSQARQEESERIQKRIADTDYVVLLDETGKDIDSPALAKLCEANFTNAKSLVFVIGGAFGVNDKLQARADYVLSLSKLVFPHQLVRLMLTEQLYRAQEISRGGDYHHC